MPVWKLQTAIWRDSVLPRDAMVMTPHFNDEGVGSDPQGLCEDLAVAIAAWAARAPNQVTVTAYDAQGTAPVYPQGTFTVGTGGAAESTIPREVAICLSFYSERNIPRQRGRVYAPAPVIMDSVSGRPDSTMRQKVGDLAGIFGGLGGVDVDWCVYSRLDDVARPVTDWWVDDEWDTIRSRGLRATQRLMGTTSEG